MGDVSLQFAGGRTPSPVRVVHESISNRTGGKSLVRQVPAGIYGVQVLCSSMVMIVARGGPVLPPLPSFMMGRDVTKEWNSSQRSCWVEALRWVSGWPFRPIAVASNALP